MCWKQVTHQTKFLFQSMYNSNDTYSLVEIPQNDKLLTFNVSFKPMWNNPDYFYFFPELKRACYVLGASF